MARTIVGLFDTFAQAQSAVNDLISAGFSRDDISVVANNVSGEFDQVETAEGGVNVSQSVGDLAKGAVRGGLYGGLTALAATVALALIPGVGPIAAVGPLSAFLGGAAIGATAGGILGGLTGLGVPEEHAGYYAEGVRRGGTLVTVNADDMRANQAADVFSRHNAVDIDRRGEYYRSTGYTRYDDNLPAYTPAQIDEDRQNFSTYYANRTPLSTTNTTYSGNYTTSTAATPRTTSYGTTDDELNTEDNTVYNNTGTNTTTGNRI